jgi:hypothetical protein
MASSALKDCSIKWRNKFPHSMASPGPELATRA